MAISGKPTPEQMAAIVERISRGDDFGFPGIREEIIDRLVDEFWSHDCHLQYLRRITDSLAHLGAYRKMTELLAVISENEKTWINIYQEDIQNGAPVESSLRARIAIGNYAMVCEGACEVVRNIGKVGDLEDMKRIIPYLGYEMVGLSAFRAVRRFILSTDPFGLREISSALDEVNHLGLKDEVFRSNISSHSYLLRRYIRTRAEALQEGIEGYP
jgi:hypothetical protein